MVKVLLQLEKQDNLKSLKSVKYLKKYQLIENILWVSLITQGRSACLPEGFTYVSFSESVYTTNLLAQVHPKATFFINAPKHASESLNVKTFTQLEDINLPIHVAYIDNVSLLSPIEWLNIKNYLLGALAPGGCIVLGYESKIGWGEYNVVFDLIKLELAASNTGAITRKDLDSVFYYLQQLAEKNITLFANKVKLNRLFQHLKSVSVDDLNKLLFSPHLNTYYAHDMFQPQHDVKYVGEMPMVNNYLHLGLTQEQKAFVGSYTENSLTAVERRDLITLPFLKMDVWSKCESDQPYKTMCAEDVYFGVYSIADRFPESVKIGNISFNFQGEAFTVLRAIFNAHGFLKISAILEKVSHLGLPAQIVVNQLMILVATEQLKVSFFPSKTRAYEEANVKEYKLKFKHVMNQNMFSDMYKFFNESGVVIDPETHLVIPFDQRMCMVMAALTKVSVSFVAQYCAEAWCKKYEEDVKIQSITAEFKSILLRFKKHYFVKFLELNLIDQVLV